MLGEGCFQRVKQFQRGELIEKAKGVAALRVMSNTLLLRQHSTATMHGDWPFSGGNGLATYAYHRASPLSRSNSCA